MVARQPFPLLFATVSGADLYGFPSPDSDWDLRGVHILPPEELLGMVTGPETLQEESLEEGFELDLVTHDLGKFVRLLLRPNGYVLEQVASPLVVHAHPALEEFRELARGCVTRHHAHHYLGFARSQRRLLEKQEPPTVKAMLYAYRVLRTGIHLMRTGEVQADLRVLQAEEALPGVAELMERKHREAERCALSPGELGGHLRALDRLEGDLRAAQEASELPEEPGSRAGLHDFLLRLRLSGRC